MRLHSHKPVSGPWWGNDHARTLFEAQAKQIYGDRLRINAGPSITVDRDYRVRVSVPEFGFPVLARVEFKRKDQWNPNIILPPDPSSPHRYAPTTPCMWFPDDPPKHKWVFKDGLYQLLLHIEWHLYRETIYHETGDWPGEEAPHAPHRRIAL